MKLWEILEYANMYKKYTGSDGKKYIILSDGLGSVSLFDKFEKEVTLLPKDVMNLEFEEALPLNGWERVDKGIMYYYIDTNGDVASGIEDMDDEEKLHEQYWLNDIGEESAHMDYLDEVSNKQYLRANYFSTLRKAKDIAYTDSLLREMRRFYELNDGYVDIEDFRYKYYIALSNTKDNVYYINRTMQADVLGAVYFSKLELAEQCIEEVIGRRCFQGMYRIKLVWEE